MTCRDCYHYGVCMDYTSLRESEFAQTFNEVENICEHFKDESTIDEVVRCSECKHLEIINKEPIYGRCNKTGFEFKLWTVDTRESYCSGGEKKGGEEE